LLCFLSSFVVQFSKSVTRYPLSRTACIVYHSVPLLSIPFFKFLEKVFRHFQTRDLLFALLLRSLSSISHCFHFVKYFFGFSFRHFCVSQVIPSMHLLHRDFLPPLAELLYVITSRRICQQFFPYFFLFYLSTAFDTKSTPFICVTFTKASTPNVIPSSYRHRRTISFQISTNN